MTPVITACSTACSAYSPRTISGSCRRSFTSETASATITTTNGSAATIVIVFSPLSASSPTSSITAATAPVAAPQKMTVRRRGSVVPRSDRVPITIEAASAPETKKMATSTITTTLASVASGNCSSIVNSWASCAPAPKMSVPAFWRSIAVPPKTANQSRLTRLGTRSTPATNWRIVRPREMRAMNMPTNGVHEIHQAQ